MSRVTDPNARIVASVPKTVQAGAPHTAAMDLDLSAKTIRLWYESERKDHSWSYSYPPDAPYVQYGAVETEYTFIQDTPSGNDEVIFPWIIGPDVDTILIYVTLAVPPGVSAGSIYVKAHTETLITAVATTDGAFCPTRGYLTTPPQGLWGAPDQPMQLAEWACSVPDPALGASGGLVGLGIDTQWVPGHQGTITTGANAVAKLVTVSAYNYKRSPL